MYGNLMEGRKSPRQPSILPCSQHFKLPVNAFVKPFFCFFNPNNCSLLLDLFYYLN